MTQSEARRPEPKFMALKLGAGGTPQLDPEVEVDEDLLKAVEEWLEKKRKEKK